MDVLTVISIFIMGIFVGALIQGDDDDDDD